MGCKELKITDYYRFLEPDEKSYSRAGEITCTAEKNRYKPVFHTVISNYRYYSPELGRWLSRDPIGEAAFFTQHMIHETNLSEIQKQVQQALMPPYIFISNAPQNKIDYFGLSIWSKTKTTLGAVPVIGTIMNLATDPPGSSVSDYAECKGENPDCTNCVKKLEVQYVGIYMGSYLLHGAGDIAMIAGGGASAKLSFGASLAFVVVGELDGIANAYAYIAKTEKIWSAALDAIDTYCCDPK